MRGLRRSRRRHDWWSPAATRRGETHALVNVLDQCPSVGTLVQELDPHRLVVLLVHNREVFSVHAVEIFGDIGGAVLATLTEGIVGRLESEGALSAVARMALKVIDNQLFVVVEVAHHDGGLDDLDGGRHSVGAADSEEASSEAATRGIACIVAREGSKRIGGGAIGRQRDGLLEDHARDGR
jgi:hypothetical protein